MIKNYFKTSLRNMWRNKGFTFLNASGLTIGLTCFIMIFLWVDDEISFDGFHGNIDNLYSVTTSIEGMWTYDCPWALGPVLKQNFPEVIGITRIRNTEQVVKAGDKVVYRDVKMVDDGFFEVFSFPLLSGDPKTVFESRNSTVLSSETAVFLFGDEDPVGKTVMINNSLELVVTGVSDDPPANSSIDYDMVIPLKTLGENRLRSWGYGIDTYVLLSENSSAEEFRTKIADVVSENNPMQEREVPVSIIPFSRIHLYALNEMGPIKYIYIFSAIAVLILLIACINFMNMTTAKAGSRAKEIGMRKVAGAVRSDIITQFLGEPVILSFAGLGAAIIIVNLLMPQFNSISGKNISAGLTENLFILPFLGAAALITGLISGSYPALFISKFKPVDIMKSLSRSGSKGFIVRRFLIVFQFSASIFLMISAVVIYNQMAYIKTVDIGIDKDNIAVIQINNDIRQNLVSVKNELKQLRNIENAASASNLPTFVNNYNPVYWEGGGSDNYTGMYFVAVDHDYFETFGIEFMQGRAFSTEFSTDGQNYIINEEALKLTRLESPIGKMFSIWENEGEIVGVINNFIPKSLYNEIFPIAFTMLPDWQHKYLFVKISDEDIPGTLGSIEETITKFAPNFPFNYSFLDDRFQSLYVDDQRTGQLFRYFSIIAVFISCLGLFGMASYMLEQRTKEIGVRKVLGASVNSIMVLLSREFVLIIVLSNLIAWPLSSYFMNKWLQNFSYRVDINLFLFVLAGTSALLIAMLTISWQTLKAARKNPVTSLKYE
ncbi:MAG: FtsX-like permease family protein [bacterium]|nr:FtsX-like permease family protein [bacterium]